MGANKNRKLKTFYILGSLTFIGFSGWWVFNQIQFNPADTSNGWFSDSYWVAPLVGGIAGLWAAKKWGGLKSVFGRAIFLLAVGLLAQVFGQIIYTYYARVQGVEAPYPSIGDVGYFGSVVLYIGGIYLLAKTAGARLSKAGNLKKILALALPLLLLAVSYIVFLKDYQVDWSHPVTVLLDFGYPLGQSIYLSLALLTYFLSKGLLGGIMKNKILLLLTALLVQYAADYSFLYRFNREKWYAGDFTDYIYLVAYFLMTIALLRLVGTVENIKHQNNQASSQVVAEN